jgi:probable rRNA maturation factor
MIVNRQRRLRLDTRALVAFVRRLAREVGLAPDDFTVALVSDRRMAALNRRYRRRSYATDVLSFTAERGPHANGYRGDVVIAVETARRQAHRFRHSLAEELQLLALHGVLHLLGYDHESDHGQMDRRERALRRRLGLE